MRIILLIIALFMLFTSCITSNKPRPRWATYTIYVSWDTAYMYHRNRYVGKIPYNDSDALTQLITEDNQ